MHLPNQLLSSQQSATVDTMDNQLSDAQIKTAKAVRKEVAQMQKIEGNPFTDEDLAMFEMFDQKRWTAEQRVEYILNLPSE